MAADAPPTALDGSGEEGGEEDVLVDELQLPLWERPGWSDLEPLHLVDSTGVVAIDYDAHHVQALGYFRAILQRVRPCASSSFVKWKGPGDGCCWGASD